MSFCTVKVEKNTKKTYLPKVDNVCVTISYLETYDFFCTISCLFQVHTCCGSKFDANLGVLTQNYSEKLMSTQILLKNLGELLLAGASA